MSIGQSLVTEGRALGAVVLRVFWGVASAVSALAFLTGIALPRVVAAARIPAAVTAAPPRYPSEDAESLTTQARASWALGDYRNARYLLDRAIAHHGPPRDETTALCERARLEMGRACLRVSRLTDSLDALGPSTPPQPRSLVYQARGTANYNSGFYDNAVHDYTTALSLNPDLSHVYFDRCLTYYANGEISRARADADAFAEAHKAKTGLAFPHAYEVITNTPAR